MAILVWPTAGFPRVLLRPLPKPERPSRIIDSMTSPMFCISSPGKEVKVIFHGPEENLALLRSQEPYLRSLARVGTAEYLTSGDRPKGAATAVVGSTEVYLPLGEMINIDEEWARLTKEVHKTKDELSRIQKK